MSSSNRDLILPTLTVRELEILKLLSLALSGKSIALTMGISTGTVKWHVKNIYQKLGACGRESALRKAHALGLIEEATVCQICERRFFQSRATSVVRISESRHSHQLPTFAAIKPDPRLIG